MSWSEGLNLTEKIAFAGCFMPQIFATYSQPQHKTLGRVYYGVNFCSHCSLA